MSNDIDFADSVGIGSAVDDDPHRNTIESFRLDNSKVIKEIDLELRGWLYDPLKEKWSKPETSKNKFGMTDECRQFVITALRTVLHKANGQGNLSLKYNGLLEYDSKVSALADTFEDHLIEKKDEYNLSDSSIIWLPVAMSQMRIVASDDPEASVLPSGENAITDTASE